MAAYTHTHTHTRARARAHVNTHASWAPTWQFSYVTHTGGCTVVCSLCFDISMQSWALSWLLGPRYRHRLRKLETWCACACVCVCVCLCVSVCVSVCVSLSLCVCVCVSHLDHTRIQSKCHSPEQVPHSLGIGEVLALKTLVPPAYVCARADDPCVSLCTCVRSGLCVCSLRPPVCVRAHHIPGYYTLRKPSVCHMTACMGASCLCVCVRVCVCVTGTHRNRLCNPSCPSCSCRIHISPSLCVSVCLCACLCVCAPEQAM